MVDNSIQLVFETFQIIFPVHGFLHPHAGNLIQKRLRIGEKNLLLFCSQFPLDAGAGEVKKHLRLMIFQQVDDSRAGSGSHQADFLLFLFRRFFQFLRLFFPLQQVEKRILLNGFAAELLVGCNHPAKRFLIDLHGKTRDLPGHIADIDKFVRKLFLQIVIEPPHAVAAGGEHQAFVDVISHDLLQHGLCKGADVGMHQGIRLVKICHLGLDSAGLRSHSLENFQRGIFTDISDHSFSSS